MGLLFKVFLLAVVGLSEHLGVDDGALLQVSHLAATREKKQLFFAALPRQYEQYHDMNCYATAGATSLQDDMDFVGMKVSVAECKDACDSDATCSCVTLHESGGCWKRISCAPSECASDSGWDTFTVHTKETTMTPTSTTTTTTTTTVLTEETTTTTEEPQPLWAFAAKPNGDLVSIKKAHTGTGMTEVHVLSAASNYQTFVLQTGTALHYTGAASGDDWEFVMGEADDLLCIKKGPRTGSGKTEVHILSAASNYQNFVLQTGTALHYTHG